MNAFINNTALYANLQSFPVSKAHVEMKFYITVKAVKPSFETENYYDT